MRRSKFLRLTAFLVSAAILAACQSGGSEDNDPQPVNNAPLRQATPAEVKAAQQSFTFAAPWKYLDAKHFYVAQHDFTTDSITEQTVIIVPRNKDGKVPARWLGEELGYAMLLLQSPFEKNDDLTRIKLAYALYDPICSLVGSYAQADACLRLRSEEVGTAKLTPIDRTSEQVEAWRHYGLPISQAPGQWMLAGDGPLELSQTLTSGDGNNIILSPLTRIVGGEVGHHRLYSNIVITRLKRLSVTDPMCLLSSSQTQQRHLYVGDFVTDKFMDRYGPDSKICPYTGTVTE